MSVSILIVGAPDLDLAPAREAADAAGVRIALHGASDEIETLTGLDAAEAHAAAIVTPPATTAPGDAYQAAVAALTADGFPVVEATLDNRAASDATHPGPLGAMAAVAGFGPMGWALAVEMLAERLK